MLPAVASHLFRGMLASRWQTWSAVARSCASLDAALTNQAVAGGSFAQFRGNSTQTPPRRKTLFLSHVTPFGSASPITLGFYNHLERHLPHCGFFLPVSATPTSTAPSWNSASLVHRIFGMQGDVSSMIGISDLEAGKMIASGKQADLMDRIYAAYASYADGKDFVLVQGANAHIAGPEFDAQVAQALNTPVLIIISGHPRMTANDYYNQAIVKRQLFVDHKVDVAGVAFNLLPTETYSQITGQLRARFEKEGLTFAGAIPVDPVLSSVRLNDLRESLGCSLVFGQSAILDKEFSDVVVASQRVEELLEILDERPKDQPCPLVLTSQDRMDVVLACLAAQVSITGPAVAGVLLTQAGHAMEGRRYAKDAVSRIFHGVEEGGTYTGPTLPVLLSTKPMADVLDQIRKLAQQPSLLPTSTSKITQAKILFDKYINAEAVVHDNAMPSSNIMTPKMFMYNLKKLCLNNPQRIVLPESNDPRILAAAAEVTQRGLAKVTLLGNPDIVLAEAKKLGVDLTGVAIHDPQNSDRIEKYVDALVEARKKKGLPRPAAYDMVKGDINMFGVMMVACGDADGMVSGAMHTTAATIRPAMQVLRTGQKSVVSSVFFMCLPDKVLVYGDCAVNPTPSAEELSQIAASSHDTAKAFGLDPRVAMLSYSTLGSGAGPDVQKVTEAVAMLKTTRPDVKVEGPIQYDAAIDPKVAKVKVKGSSEVAGKATVFVFPDLNTGNNTYKAVQQASGAIAMGPVMQGLTKPVNDLSRGCTIPDVVNTICVTSIQAQQAHQAANK